MVTMMTAQLLARQLASFEAANSNASVKTILSKIESVFGLPRGSVCLLDPNGKSAPAGSKIRSLREKWKRTE